MSTIFFKHQLCPYPILGDLQRIQLLGTSFGKNLWLAPNNLQRDMAVDMKDDTQPTVNQTLPESGSVDDAWAFLNKSYNADTDDGIVDIKTLRRTVDWHIVPLMFGCYTMQFLDKVLLNVSRSHQYADLSGLISLQYAAVMGIHNDIRLIAMISRTLQRSFS